MSPALAILLGAVGGLIVLAGAAGILTYKIEELQAELTSDPIALLTSLTA
jgi:hypothetical protein